MSVVPGYVPMYGGFLSLRTFFLMLAATASCRILLRRSQSPVAFSVSGAGFDAPPRLADVFQASGCKSAVREIGKPPGFRFWRQARVGLAPTMNQAIAWIVGGQSQAFVVHFAKERGRCCDLFLMLQEQGAVAGVIEIFCEQHEFHAELRGLRAAHIDHAFRVREIGEVVVDYGAGHFEATPFEICTDRHGENVLEAVVFRAVIVTINGSVFGINAARANHQLLRKSVTRHIDPSILWEGGRRRHRAIAVPNSRRTARARDRIPQACGSTRAGGKAG